MIIDTGSERHHLIRSMQPGSGDLDVVPAYDLCDITELSAQGTIGAFYCSIGSLCSTLFRWSLRTPCVDRSAILSMRRREFSPPPFL